MALLGAWPIFCCFLFPSPVLSADDSVRHDRLQVVRQALERKEYDRVLSLVEPLLDQAGVSPEVHRLKIRGLLGLKRPMEALDQYDRLEAQLGHEDRPLLHDVAIAFIPPLLTDMREQMRGAAYTALKELESDEVLPYLEDGLSDGSGLVRALAVEGLGKLSAGRRSGALRKALEDQAARVRAAAIKALGRGSDRAALPMIEKALQDDQQIVRLTAAAVLAKWGRGEALDRVRDTAATAANPEQRADALRALGELQDRESIMIVRQALHDEQPSVRGAAATAIGKLAVAGTSALLAGLLHDSIPAVRAAAATGLGELHEADSLPLLRKALNDPNPAVRGAVVSSLLKLKTPYAEVASVVSDLAHNSDPGIRAMTARVLAVSTEPPAKEILKLLLVDPLPRPRIAAARVLGQMGDEKQIAILKKALRDSDDAVRATAGAAVARLLSHRTDTKSVEK